VPMSSLALDKDCSIIISSLNFSLEEEFMSMSLNKGLSSNNCSQFFFCGGEVNAWFSSRQTFFLPLLFFPLSSSSLFLFSLFSFESFYLIFLV